MNKIWKFNKNNIQYFHKIEYNTLFFHKINIFIEIQLNIHKNSNFIYHQLKNLKF